MASNAQIRLPQRGAQTISLFPSAFSIGPIGKSQTMFEHPAGAISIHQPDPLNYGSAEDRRDGQMEMTAIVGSFMRAGGPRTLWWRPIIDLIFSVD